MPKNTIGGSPHYDGDPQPDLATLAERRRLFASAIGCDVQPDGGITEREPPAGIDWHALLDQCPPAARGVLQSLLEATGNIKGDGHGTSD